MPAKLDELRIWRRALGAAEVADLYQFPPDPVIGLRSCPAVANSSGQPTTLLALGSPQVATNQVHLLGLNAPANQPGLCFFGTAAVQLPGGHGIRCSGGSLIRILPPSFGDAGGVLETHLDLTGPPLAATVLPGVTSYWQLWYRDPVQGPPGFNFSDMLEITWQ